MDVTAKEESEELMNSVLPLAKEMLADYREFYPYGGYMKPDGEIVHVGAKDPDTDHPKSQYLIDLLQTSFQQLACDGKCKAVAIVCDVRVQPPGSHEKSDAIQVSLDHVDGYSVRVFLPYSFVNDEIVYGEIFASSGDNQIFVSKPE